MTFLSLVAMAALCLVFASTRKYALLTAAAGLYLYPQWTLGLLLAAIPVALYLQLKTRRWSMEDYVLDALEMVMAWELPDEEFADAVNDQARLMAGLSPEDFPERHPDA